MPLINDVVDDKLNHLAGDRHLRHLTAESVDLRFQMGKISCPILSP